MTYTTSTPIRTLLGDAISEYISDTGDAPHYRVHLLDLLESTLQADPQDTDLVRTPRGIAIIAGEPEFKDDDSDTLMDHLQAMSYNHKDVETLFEIPELLEVRAELTARLRTPGTVEISREDAARILLGNGSVLAYPEEHGRYSYAITNLMTALTAVTTWTEREAIYAQLDGEDTNDTVQ